MSNHNAVAVLVPAWVKVLTTVMGSLIVAGILASVSAAVQTKVLAEKIGGNQRETERRLEYISSDVTDIKRDMNQLHDKVEDVDRRVLILENSNS